MEKLIKLSDAVKAVCKGCLKENPHCRHHWDCPMLTNLGKLPSADRPKGEWIETPNHTIRCSVCGAEFTDDIMDACLTSRLKHPRACSVCTASMKGADDEDN